MTSRRVWGAGASAAGCRSGTVFTAVKAEEALREGRVTVNCPTADPGAAVVGDPASEVAAMDEGARAAGSGAGRSGVHELFRSSRVIKVEALESRRVELSQTSGSAEEAKSPADNGDNSARQRSVTETVRPSQDAAVPVKYEWQDTRRPQVSPLPAEIDAQVAELIVVADAAPPPVGAASGGVPSHSIEHAREAESSDPGSKGRQEESLRNKGKAARKKGDTRSYGVHGAGSCIEVPSLENGNPEGGSGEAVEAQPGGRVTSELECRGPSAGGEAEIGGTWTGPEAGPQPPESLGPAVVAHLEKGTSVCRVSQIAQSQGNGFTPASLRAAQERALQPTGRESFVETLHNFRSSQKRKRETVSCVSLTDEKVSVLLTGVKEFETSSGHPFGGDQTFAAESGQPSVPRISVDLPDLNEGGPTAAAVKFYLDGQQEEQLRAQILVYGALIHGNQIDESLMESAFGDGISEDYRFGSGKSEGKTLWEESWRTTCERLKARELALLQVFPAEGTSGRTDMSDGIHVEVVASLDEVPDSPMSTESLASPGIALDEDEAGTVVPVTPLSPPFQAPEENLEGTGPASPALLQIVDMVTRTGPMIPESDANPVTTPATAQDNLSVVVESITVQVEHFEDVAPGQQVDHVDGGVMVEEIGLNVVRSSGDNRSGVNEVVPSHAKRSPLTAVWSQLEEAGVGLVSGLPSATPDTIPTTDLDTTEADTVTKRIETASDTSGVVVRPVDSAEGLEDAMTISPPAAPVQNDGTQQAADLTQVAVGGGARLDSTYVNPASSDLGHPISELRQDTLERDGSRDGAVSQLDQARLNAEEAAADAASALQQSQAVWTRVHAEDHSGLTVEKQQQLASAAVSVAAAASVAKANAAIAKLALEAASQARLTADESTEKVLPSASSLGQGVLHAAKEQTLKRAEDAAAASKRAQLLNAVARAAELATEAAQQIGAVIAMGDPLKFSLEELDQAGINGHWKLGSTLENTGNKSGQTKGRARKPAKRKAPSQPPQAGKEVKDKSMGDSSLKALSKKGSISAKKKKELSELKSGLKVVKRKKSVTVRLKTRAKPKPVAESVPPPKLIRAVSSKSLAKPKVPKSVQDASASAKSPHRIPAVPVSKSTRTGEVDPKRTEPEHDGSVTEGSVVEVLADEEGLQGAWFSGKVLRIQGVEALVVYDEILADDGTTPLQELVPLGAQGNGAPKIRLAHPINFSKNEGAKKRRRSGAGVGNRLWVVGEKVDAWIRDGWWEGRIEAVNAEDETKVTVHFPGEGDTSVIKSWDLRPSLVWRDGNWVLSSDPQVREDEQPAKRQKVASKPLKAQTKKGKGTNTVSTGGKGAAQGKSTNSKKKGTSESETQLKAGVQDVTKPTKKRKLAEISEAGETDNFSKSISKQKTGKGNIGHGELTAEKEKGGTTTEKQASKSLTKSKALTDEEQTPAGRTRRTGGQQTIEIVSAPELGSKSPRQASGGPGKASTPTKSSKQSTGGQGKASTPAKSTSKGKKASASRKRPAKRTPGKEAVLEKDTSPADGSTSTGDAPPQETNPAKDAPATRSAPPYNNAPLAKSAPPTKGAAPDKAVFPAKGVSSSRATLPDKDVPPASNVPPVKDAAPPKETVATKHTPRGKDGRRGSTNQPTDAGPSAKRQKTQKGGKGRRAPEQDRRKSSRKAQPPSKVSESQGNLNKQDTEQGWKTDTRFGTPRRTQTLGLVYNNLLASRS